MSVQGLRFNLRVGAILVWCALMTACSSTLRTAPIIERSAGTNKPAQPATPVQSPRTAPVAATTNAGDSNGPNYVVKKGDTLPLIAKNLNVSRTDLAEANYLSLKAARLTPGQKLLVPRESTAIMAARAARRGCRWPRACGPARGARVCRRSCRRRIARERLRRRGRW